MRQLLAISVALAIGLGGASGALAATNTSRDNINWARGHGTAQCRDAKGKFTKCPAPAAQQCRDAKGHFAKCGTPGAKPIPVKH